MNEQNNPDSRGADELNTMYRAPESDSSPPPADDLLSVFVGPRNADYYAGAFQKFASGAGNTKWNWPAFFLTLPWLLYRKLWMYALAYMFLVPIALIAVGIATELVVGSGSGLTVYYLLYFIIGFVIAPLFAARLYYGHAVNKIAAIEARSSSDGELRLEVARAGSTSIVGVVVAFIVLFVPILGIISAISIPAYQDYTIRAQVSEGLNLSMGAKAAVTEYVLSTGEYPENNDTAGLPAATEISGSYVSGVNVSAGEIAITYGNQAHSRIHGETLMMVPELTSTDEITWTCFSAEIPAKHLPAACR